MFLEAELVKASILRAIEQEALSGEAEDLARRARGAHPSQASGLLMARHAVLLEHALKGGLKGHPC